MKRILYLDTLRGFLIFYVVFIHAVLLIIFQADYDYIDILPLWLIALLFPLLLIAMWGPMFSMMSATTNTYLVYHQIEKGKDLKNIILTRISSYLLIIIVHIINMVFFIHFIPLDGKIYRSLICGTLETGQLTIPNMLMFLNSGTLLLIGLSGVLINLLLLFLWKNNNHRNIRKTILFFVILSIIFLLIRPFIYPTINSIILNLAEQNHLVSAILLSWMFRGQFGLIPMVAIPFFGVIFGLLQAAKVKKQSIIKTGIFSVIGLIIASMFFIILFGIPDLTLPYWPVAMVTINLALMIFATTLLIVRYEHSPPIKRTILAKRSIFFRRFSMITLTIFVFESIIAVIWAKIFSLIFIDPFPYNVVADVLFLCCVITTWYGIVRIWEKYNFKYSIEWFMIRIIAWITGKTSQKLDVQKVLYNPIESEKPSSK